MSGYIDNLNDKANAVMLTAFEQRTITRTDLNVLLRSFGNFEQVMRERFIRFADALRRGYISVVEDGARIDNYVYYMAANGSVTRYEKSIFEWSVNP